MKEMLVSESRDIFSSNSISFDERQQQLEEEEKKEQERRKREKESPFSRWAQFNLEHSKTLMWLAMKHPKAHSVLYFLVDHMDEYNAVMCSYKVLEEVFGVSNATVTRAVRILKDCGIIAVLKSGTSNVYAVNHKFFWKSWGNNRKYSKFPANVVITMSEQEKEQQKEYRQSLEEYQESFKDLKTVKHKEVFKNSENQGAQGNENDIADSERTWSVETGGL